MWSGSSSGVSISSTGSLPVGVRLTPSTVAPKAPALEATSDPMVPTPITSHVVA